MSLASQTHREASLPPLVLADSVTWRLPTGQVALDGVTLAIAREKTGLVGDNGSGKTTLARILIGELAPTSGSVSRAGRFALLPQDVSVVADHSVATALGVEDKLAALARLSGGRGLPGDLATLDDDWSLEGRIATQLERLGLGHIGLDRRMGTLSGGETTRVLLAALLLKPLDLIILDEPTNNLDQQSRQALYEAVKVWPAGLLVVSHDRELLGLMDRIVELSSRGLRSYGGNYELYRTQRDTESAAAERQLEAAAQQLRKTRREAQAARERQERRSSRGKKARDKGGMAKVALNTRRDASQRTTARLADTFEARVQDAATAVTAAQVRAAENRELDIRLAPVDLPAGKTVLDMEHVSFRYDGGRPLLEGVSLRIVGPERIAVVGPNGSGKTTLLKLILERMQPTSGRVRVGVERITCLDQHAELLDPQRSVLENFRAWNATLPETSCRLTLAHFLFRSDDVHQLCGTLGGGERLRAALVCVLTGVDPPQLLMLDEPTNHLDLASLANLEQALRQYTGALLVISHDRTFLSNIGVRRTVELGSVTRGLAGHLP